MKEKSRRTPPNKILQAVTAQSIKSHGLVLPGAVLDGPLSVADLVSGPLRVREQPFREIDGTDVFHAAVNLPPFATRDFDSSRLHLWGRFRHPCVVLASYPIGGEIRLYIDTRYQSFYALWTATRVDDVSEFGSGAAYDLVTWTPKRKGDTIALVGFCLVHALLLETLFVKHPNWHCDAMTAEGFEGSGDVADVIGAIAPTLHRSKKDLEARLAKMPAYLRPLYRAGASLGAKELLYSTDCS
jgi:hypothetical protein